MPDIVVAGSCEVLSLPGIKSFEKIRHLATIAVALNHRYPVILPCEFLTQRHRGICRGIVADYQLEVRVSLCQQRLNRLAYIKLSVVHWEAQTDQWKVVTLRYVQLD